MKNQWIYLLLSCLLMTSVGCGASVSVAEEDEHLEHHIPEHKPSNLIDAWSQVKLRLGRLQPETTTQEFTELHDIINWLPELAADSDLKRGAWDKINEVSQELSAQASTPAIMLTNRDKMIALLDRNIGLLVNAGRSTQIGHVDQQPVEEETHHD